MYYISIMVKHARRGGKRAARRRAPAKRITSAVTRRGKKSTARQYATIQETIEVSPLYSGVNNSLVFNLMQFERASAVAQNFRWYKATKVIWTLEPLFTVYQDGVGGDTVPYIYKIMDRTQDSLAMNLTDLQASGCRPIKLTSTKVFSYTPNWCSPGLTTFTRDSVTGAYVGGTVQGMRAQYAWLAAPHGNGFTTAPNVPSFIIPSDTRNPIPATSGFDAVETNQVCYNGMDLYLDQATNVGEERVCKMTCTVHWEFKDPKFNGFVRDPPPPPKDPLVV